jgi:hypothetical protein
MILRSVLNKIKASSIKHQAAVDIQEYPGKRILERNNYEKYN